MSPLRWLAVGVTLVVGIGAGVVSIERTREQMAVIAACDAAERGDWSLALSGTHGRTGDGATGRAAAECRCTALIATGAGDACEKLMTSLLAQTRDEAWAPAPALSVHLVQRWREAGRGPAAADLARRAGRAHPEHPAVFQVELEARASVEDEARVLEELAARVPAEGEAAARMRVSLAQRALHAADAPRALAALGDVPPPGSGAALGLWYDTRAIAHAMTGNVAAARAVYEAWGREGADPAELRARYALALSIAGVSDPERDTITLLRDALAGTAAQASPKLREALAIRLVLSLVNAGRVEDALAVYDAERAHVPLEGLRREELQRAALHRVLADVPPEERRGTLRFEIEDVPPGSVLYVSPEPDAEPDTDYVAIDVPEHGVIEVERAAGIAPQRWVLRGGGRVLGSGTQGPRPLATVTMRVHPGAARPAPAPAALSRSAGDGRRRVMLVLLDCGDWRIVQYLRARGELPVLEALLASGHRAVLDSDPPLTAAALEALVWPRRRGDASFVGSVHRFGVELSGLASVGRNPVDWLSWVMPESDDLFAVVGAGPRSAANLLLAHGGIRAGRHGEVTGPDGQRRSVPAGRAARDLDREERRRWPAIARVRAERDAHHVRTIAAELDAAVALAGDRSLDLVALRVEPLDLLTHAHFAESVADGRDDGQGLLFEVYRYIDARLEAVYAALDADDVLVVMSDHGIRTAMEHARDAIFIATGEGIGTGRAPGRPALRGVSRTVADWLGVQTAWPDTGITAPSRAQAGVSR